MAKKSRVKAAAIDAPQSFQECGIYLAQLGETERDIAVSQAALAESQADLKLKFEAELRPLKDRRARLHNAIQAYCEANRAELTGGGKRKSVKFAAGTISWRMTPLSVKLKGVDEVIRRLQGLGLRGFLREKTEVNKEAILADANSRALAAGIEGISIGQREEFVIEPLAEESA